MADIIMGGGETLDEPTSKTPEDFVRSLFTVLLNDLQGAWLSASDATDATRRCFKILTQVLEDIETVSFNLNFNVLVVNGTTIEFSNPKMSMVIRHLGDLETGKITLTRGIAWDSFEKLVHLLSTRKEEIAEPVDFSEALRRTGAENIFSKKISYREISDEEVVLTKTEVETALDPEDARNVLAFLKSDASSHDEQTVKVVNKVAAESDQLAELIVAVAQEQDDDATGGAPGQAISSALQRAIQGLMLDPALSTQKGKKKLKGILARLEKSLLSKSQSAFGELGDDFASAVSAAIGEATDEIEMDSIAADYAKRRIAISSSEEKLLKYIRSKGMDKLDDGALWDKLSASGLSSTDWEDLLRKGDVPLPSQAGNIEVIGHLATLLSSVEEEISATSTLDGTDHKAKFTKVLDDVNREVKKLADKTNEKIRNLVDTVQADQVAVEAAERAAKKEGKGPRMSRRKMLELLAEIVQELCQPLAVVNCTLQMLTGGHLGEITDSQSEAISLAGESVEKMSVLTDNLLGIAGFPSTMEPDEAVQKSLYEEDTPDLGGQVWG